jgi:hypothetical protein
VRAAVAVLVPRLDLQRPSHAHGFRALSDSPATAK